MSKVRDYIQRIVNDGQTEDMEELSYMLEELICDLKDKDMALYKEYKKKLYGIAHHYQFDEELAEEIVTAMKPYGEKWNISAISNVRNQYNLGQIPLPELYIVMNSAYNDFYELFGDNLDYYVKYSRLFVEDDDAIHDKVWKYYNIIPKKD